MISQKLRVFIGILGSTVALLVISSSAPVFATTNSYGSGDYGECAYSASSSTCSISISNNGFTLLMNVTPTPGGSCTIQSDQVTVSTYDPNGYSLTLGNASTNNTMQDTDNSGNDIPATAGTLSLPIALADAWGYRVDSAANFGSGPTSAETNGAPNSSLYFANTEPSSNSPDTIVDTSTLDSSPSPTTVWYGVCLDNGLSVPTGTYASTVQYTVTAN